MLQRTGTSTATSHVHVPKHPPCQRQRSSRMAAAVTDLVHPHKGQGDPRVIQLHSYGMVAPVLADICRDERNGGTMMRVVAAVVAVLACATAHAEPQVCPSATGRSVMVTGTGRIRVVPDKVTFSVGVATEAALVTQALRENHRKAEAVISALKTAGVRSEEIQTSGLRIRQGDGEGKRPGFVVENTVTVTRKDVKAVGELLEAAVNAGANQADGPSFGVSDDMARRELAFELAYQDARARARKLAALSGKTLGEVVCIAEGGWPQGGGVGNFTEAVIVSAAPAVEEGREEVAFNVSVVFELK